MRRLLDTVGIDVLGDSGILDELVAQGVEEEDTIKIGEYEFDYLY